MAAENGVVNRRDSPNPLTVARTDYTHLYGYLLLVCTYLFFVISLYTIVISKLMPVTGNKILDLIREDNYYCLLVPSTMIATVYAVAANWMGLKIFRHN